MKLTLPCNIVPSMKTHSSDKESMSPLLLHGDSSLIAFENFCTKTLLCSEDFCKYEAIDTDVSPFKKVLTKDA